MPSQKKRINLTVPDSIYEQLQEYKLKQGITNDAGACLQLIVQQLKAQEESALMLQMINRLSLEEVQSISFEGMKAIKSFADTRNADKV